MLRPDDFEKVSGRLRVVVGDAQPPGLPRRAQPSQPGPHPAGRRASDTAVLDDELADVKLDDRPAPDDDTCEAEPLRTAGTSDGRVAWRSMLLRLGRTHAGALTVLLVVALVLTGSRVMAARGHAVDAASATPSVTPAASASAPSAAPMIQVHVMGAVVAPGVVSVPAGSRVGDAIVAAGGLRDDADCAELNLAADVPDGAQIVIGTGAEPRGEMRTGQADSGGGGSGGISGSGNSGGGSSSGLVNLNTATAAQLEALPGVGPVMAQRIVDWRTANGGFTRIEELQEVDGIGAKTYAKLAPLVQV